MLVKLHISSGKKIVSIADKNILGKEFEEGEKYLNVSKIFYGGEELNEKETINSLNGASSINIVGKESIKFALDNKLIKKENIMKVNGVPYAITIFYAE